MNSWPELIEANHAWAHANDGWHLVTGAPATDADLAQLETQLGIELPAEFKELYRTYNGVGICREANDGQAPGRPIEESKKVLWLLVPVAEIPGLMTVARSWFQETHAEVALQFMPFIDWNCGDYTGYLLPLESDVPAELYTFEHENYEFDEAQEAEEFLLLSYESIRDYFSTR